MITQSIDEKAIFNEARRIADAVKREQYLAEACYSDPSVIRRIGELLQIHAQEQSFLESPAVDLTPWDAVVFSVLAMANHGLDEYELASDALVKTERIIVERMPETVLESGYDWLHAQILYQEAKKLLHVKEKKSGGSEQPSTMQPGE